MLLAVSQFLYHINYLNKHFLALPIKYNTPLIVPTNIKTNVLNTDGSHHSIYDNQLSKICIIIQFYSAIEHWTVTLRINMAITRLYLPVQ